jgi:hypothetical protein
MAAVKPPRPCARCGEMTPAADFVKRGYLCSACRSVPPPSQHKPRVCFGCHVLKPANEFPWGDGSRAKGDVPQFRRHSPYCKECAGAREEAKAAAEAERAQGARTFLRDGTLLRKCYHRECGRVLPLVEGFYRTGVDGSGKPLYTYECKVCQRERVNARARKRLADPVSREGERAKRRGRMTSWRARNREVYLARQKEWKKRQRAAETVEEKKRRLELERIDDRLRRHRKGVKARDTTHAWALEGSQSIPRLPAAPLAHAIGRWTAAREKEEVCAVLGINPRVLLMWEKGERSTVLLDAADTVLQRGGLLWWDVWVPCGEHREWREGCDTCLWHGIAETVFEGDWADLDPRYQEQGGSQTH